MKYVTGFLVLALIVAHHDFWNWDDTTLLGGFLPIGIAYHMGISLAASLVWLIACLFCWPVEREQHEPENPTHVS